MKNATASFSSSSSGSSSASRASLGKKWGRPAATASRASSAERWDAHLKKPCPLQGGGSDDVDGQSSTGSNDMELDDVPQRAFDSGVRTRLRRVVAGAEHASHAIVLDAARCIACCMHGTI